MLVLGSNDVVGSTFYYLFWVVWYFGCFNITALLYGDFIEQDQLRSACMFGVNTELTHTFTLNYSDLVWPE